MRKTHYHISALILCLIIIDLVTTFVGLSIFGGEEINPVINYLSNWWVIVIWKIGSASIATFVSAKMIHTFYPALATLQGIFVCGYIGLIVNNISWW